MTDMHSVVAGLRAVPPGLLPPELFYEVCRLGVLSAVEVVPVRQGMSGVEVLLTQREATDPFWPLQWHNPGTIMRPTDSAGSFSEAFSRICKHELGLSEWGNPVFVAPYFWKTPRGTVVSLVHYLELPNYAETPTAQFFAASELPDEFVPGMEPIIQLAVGAYTKTV